MKCAYQECPFPDHEIKSDQTPYRVMPGVIVHYRTCKPSIENEIHVNGSKLAFEKTVLGGPSPHFV